MVKKLKLNEPMGYFERTNPKLIRMREYFDNLDNNTPEQNIEIAMQNSILNENEYINNTITNIWIKPTNIINTNIINSETYNFSYFKSGSRSSNSIEGIKGLK